MQKVSAFQACVTDADVGGLCHTGSMLILHTSDWHLGRTLHGASLGDSADAFIEWLVALVRERDVDAVLISTCSTARSRPWMRSRGCVAPCAS